MHPNIILFPIYLVTLTGLIPSNGSSGFCYLYWNETGSYAGVAQSV